MARTFKVSAQDKPSLVPEREVQTGIGAVKVKAPRVRDRGTDEKIRFQSGILPKYVRRTKSLEALIPWLYLKGVSSNAMQDALSALLGPDAPNPRLRGGRLCRRIRFCGSPRAGWASLMLGNSATYRQDTMSICGRMGYIFRPRLSLTIYACSSLLARHQRAKRSLSASPMAIGKAHKAGVNCCLISNRAASHWRHLWQQAMAGWAFGPLCERSFRSPLSNAAGFIKRLTSSTSCRNPVKPRPRPTCRTFGWQTRTFMVSAQDKPSHASRQKRHLIISLINTEPNMKRLSPV